MKVSIRMKITLMVGCFSLFILFFTWVICNYVIAGVFIWNVKYNLKQTYDSCNELFDAPDYGLMSDGELFGKINNPMEAVVLILDPVNDRIYTTISDEVQMMDSLNAMLRTVDKPGAATLYESGEYKISRNHDNIVNADFYDLVGKIDNGFTIILRSPVTRIELAMRVVTKVFIYVGFGLVIVGSAFILLMSNIFASPIKRMSYAARRMSNLDFDARVPVRTRDEIGELGESMNAMSEKLEETISKLKAANAKLQRDIDKKEEIDDMRKEFLSHVSHELKTPIALIQGYAEGLRDDMADTPEDREFYTGVIIDEAAKMNSLVKKLLTLNEIEFGENPLQITRFELSKFVRDILNAQKILIDEAGVTVEFEEEPVHVWADEFMIEEVFTNYLTNATHYADKGGKIKIWFDDLGTCVRVSVFDQGPQIAPEDIDKLFVKFYKADKARTREYGGSGIGLSIVAATMDAHGRAYGCYNLEEGPVFYFELDKS